MILRFLMCLGLLLGLNSVGWSGDAVQTPQEEGLEYLLFEDIPLVVTASKKEEKLRDAPSVASVITEEQIKKFGATNLREVLERAPSVYMTSSYLYHSGAVSMRGDFQSHVNNHVLFLINGRQTRDPVFGGIDMPLLNAFPVQNIKKIEVVRGPGSVLYGTNAYTGVINVITKDFGEKTAGEIGTQQGSYSTSRYFASVQLPGETIQVDAGVNYLSTDGWNFQAQDEARVTSSADMPEDNLGVFFRGKAGGFTLSGLLAKSETDAFGIIALWPFDYVNTERNFVDAGYEWVMSDAWKLNCNLTYNYNSLEAPDTGKNAFQEGHDTLVEATLYGQIGDKVNVVLGASHDPLTTKFAIENIKADTTRKSFYGQADYQALENLKLVGGAQWNKSDSSDSEVVPRVSCIYNFTLEWGIKALYGEAFRSPYPVETDFATLSRVLIGNPDLEPEKVKTTDLQLSYQTSQVQLALTYFQSTQENRIVRVPSASSPGSLTFANRGELDFDGIELEGNASLSEHLSLIASYLYQQNEDQLNREQVTFMPDNMAKLGLSYSGENGVSLAVFNSYYADREDVNVVSPARRLVNPTADAYNWLTANLSLDLSKLLGLSGPSWMFQLYGVNLLDEDVYDPEANRRIINTLPARAGRAGYATVSVKY